MDNGEHDEFDKKAQKKNILRHEESSDNANLPPMVRIEHKLPLKGLKSDPNSAGVQMKNGLKLDKSSESEEHDHEHHNQTDTPENMKRFPRFSLNTKQMDGGFHLPEENKHNFEIGSGKLKIDFSNDPVMKALMETKVDQCELRLQSIYLSKNCKYLYIALAVICSLLVLWTIFDRKVLKENAFFIIVELCVNVVLVIDISCKIKLAG